MIYSSSLNVKRIEFEPVSVLPGWNNYYYYYIIIIINRTKSTLCTKKLHKK